MSNDTEFLRGLHLGTQDKAQSAENIHWSRHLAENVRAARTLKDMKPIIDAFGQRFVAVFWRKCMDGRTHGSKGIGIPPTTIDFGRTDGNKADVARWNIDFWRPIHQAAVEAEYAGRGEPALFMTEGHTSRRAHGCAAHHKDGDSKEMTARRALDCVTEQAEAVRSKYGPDKLYAIPGLVDTDTMERTWQMPGGVTLSTRRLITDLGLSSPEDVFAETYLRRPIDDPLTSHWVQGKTPKELLTGREPPMYANFAKTLAMQDFLLRETAAAQRGGSPRNHVVHPDFHRALEDVLSSVGDMPPAVRRVLTYMMTWNTAYALYQESRLNGMEERERTRHLEHAETMVAYGSGFHMQPRNSCLLVKPGRGNDEDPLKIAKKVLEHNRAHYPQSHPPLVHTNVELSEPIVSAVTAHEVVARLRTKLEIVREAFGGPVRVLSTYSTTQGKEFYPIRANGGDGVETYPIDMFVGLQGRHFDPLQLRMREEQYTRAMLGNRVGNIV